METGTFFLLLYLHKNILAVKRYSPVQNGHCEKNYEIKGGSQGLAEMVYMFVEKN